MATIKPVTTQVNDDSSRVVWVGVANGDTCEAYNGASEYSDRSVQMSGNFGGATMGLKGSNDGAEYHSLTDPQGLSIAMVAPGIKQITEYTFSIKPEITGGSGSSITITLIVKRQRR